MKYHPVRKTPNKAGLVCLLVALGLFSFTFLRTRLSHAQGAFDEVRRSEGLAAAKDQTLNAVPGEIIVRFQNDAPAARATAKGGDLAQFAATEDGRQLRIQIEGIASGSELVEGLRMVRVAPEETADALEILRSRSDVVYAEPNYVRRKLTTPNDPNFV
ncbi:MAG TPA: hypothetical protein VN476_09415, partial [Pyrinomonadaceae bacterium]|nr:hypothetical protein [Pyrinomonadaceae bacterium]